MKIKGKKNGSDKNSTLPNGCKQAIAGFLLMLICSIVKRNWKGTYQCNRDKIHIYSTYSLAYIIDTRRDEENCKLVLPKIMSTVYVGS